MSDPYLCIDCREVHVGSLDSGKGFRHHQSSPHWDHRIVVLNPRELPPGPIRNTAVHIGAGLPESDNAMRMFALAVTLENLCPPAQSTAPDAVSASPRTAADAQESAASMNSQPASTPTSTTDVPDLLTLLSEAAE